MQNTWNGDTRGLGAGSYPEPPDTPEDDSPVCAECGWQRDLKEVDGRLLCRDCRFDRYIKTAKESQKWDFVQHDDKTALQFFKEWWFDNLDDREQFLILRVAFTNACVYQISQEEKDEMLTDFCTANQDEFGTFLEGIA